MHVVYFILRYYWAFALPIGLVMLEVAWFMKRRGSKSHWMFWIMAFFLITTTALWIIFGGYNRSDQWVREVDNWLTQ